MIRLLSLAKVLVPATIFAVALYIYRKFLGEWAFALAYYFGFIVTVYIAVKVSGRIRDGATTVATVLLCLGVIDTCAIIKLGPANTRHTTSINRLDDVLGWASTPGVDHETKYDPKTGKVVADADITVDSRGLRKVVSAQEGPTIAFFGDSMTFGVGVADAETLPQLFADLSGRRLRVLNLAVGSYGPQQFLRALETDLFKDVLEQPRLFVYLTSQWHAERTSCMPEFVFLAPRYELVDGRLTFKGRCHGLVYALLARSAIYRAFVQPAIMHIAPRDIDLYVGILIRAAELAREKYGAPTVILYLPDPDYARQSGFSDEQIMQRLRHAGLKVINVWLDQHDYPGRPLAIPGDGHPTGVANLARAKMLYGALGDLAALPVTLGANATPAAAAPSLHHAASSICMTSSGERIGCGLVRTH
jgi:hypothetical protein